MKHVICGSEEGYLIPKKEFEEKLIERFETLKGKHIASLGLWTSRGISVMYYDKSLIKKEKDAFILPTDKDQHTLYFDSRLLKEIFNLKKEVKRCELKDEFEKGKFHDIYGDDAIMDKGNLYYFLNTREKQFYDVISELPET